MQSGCRSVAFTYNDPVIFLEYAIDVAQACRERGLKNVAVTAGYICAEPRAELFAPMDAANVDLKAFTEGFYRKLCTGPLQPVLDTLVYLRHETDVWLEITTLLIPGQNDSAAEIEALSALVRWTTSARTCRSTSPPFIPTGRCWTCPRRPRARFATARAIAMGHGLRYVYTGNIHDAAGQSTWCHACGAALIGRDWYHLTAWNLTSDGRCAGCETACAGVFETRPGAWGRRRMPVSIGGGRRLGASPA